MRTQNWMYSLAVAGLANCQTPPGHPPTRHHPLIVEYGNLTITPNLLVPQTETTSAPTISLPYHCRKDETYMLYMLDLSLPTSNLPPNLTLTPGLEPNRSTYLHWLQGNLTSTPHGDLIPHPGTETLAPYVPPSPNPGDIPHTYAFYLFRQPRGFRLEGVNAERDLEPLESFDRIGFSVEAVAEERGVELVAGMYLREVMPAMEK